MLNTPTNTLSTASRNRIPMNPAASPTSSLRPVTPTSVVGRVDKSSLVPLRWVKTLTGLSTLTTPFDDSHAVGKMSVTLLTAAPAIE